MTFFKADNSSEYIVTSILNESVYSVKVTQKTITEWKKKI